MTPASSTARPSPRGARRGGRACGAAAREHGLVPGTGGGAGGRGSASQVYVRNKHAQTVEAGMASFEHRLPAETPRPTFWR